VTRGAPKSLPSRIRRGQQGINLIERIVLEMGSSWSPSGALDVGIDGTIELFDPHSHAALGKILGVQSKVVANPKNETDEGFDYYCEERDLNYWLQSNLPVVLIVSQPERGEAFWLSIKDYYNSPERRKSRKLHFSKRENRFDCNSLTELLSAGAVSNTGSARLRRTGRTNRDEFTEKTKLKIAKRAGWLCSDPSCRRPTVGANSDGDGEISVGTAAHICAAAPDGPRYDANQTSEQRRSADNGIWMCRVHGTAIDAKDSKFTVKLLHQWKEHAQKDSWQRVLYPDSSRSSPIPAPTDGELRARLRAAAAADLDIFRRTDKWPSTSIPLTLEVDGLADAVTTSALATALTTLDDLILVAPPGTGKTTTVFQIADAVLAHGIASPIVVPLGDWSTDNATVLESVLRRPAFREITEDHVRTLAAKSEVILLLDGWNELDTVARQRLAAQIRLLQAELPELSLLISTRKQALDVPVNGTRVNLLPLNSKQQLEIAGALRGTAGVRMVDQALRTAGVRELVTIPLYLTALLALAENAPFPTTKEELLSRFVAAHEQGSQHAEALTLVTHGLHQRFLEDLAVAGTRAANTTIAESSARRSISKTDETLVTDGQITDKPQPNAVLDALVNHHVLVRASDGNGFSFQHQQFQEWFASHFVERLVLASIGDSVSRDLLQNDVLNMPAWEESILFACERLARGSQRQQEACGAAILTAFHVDPMLAAEMIFRSTDVVWAYVSETIQTFVARWHTPGKVDRSLRFMIGTGRPEFMGRVWPLITHENDQVRAAAFQAGRRFRPSLLGSDATERIAALSPKIRKRVLHDIAADSAMDGLDLATMIAAADPDAEVKAAVIEALAFRHADRHVADILRDADERTFDLVIRKDLLDESSDEFVKRGIEAARGRNKKAGVSPQDRLRTILYSRQTEDASAELTGIIAEMEIGSNQDAGVSFLYELHNRYPRATVEGLLRRVREGKTLFYGADDILASVGLSLEDDALLDIALADATRHDDRAQAAASVLGPFAVGRLIDAAQDVKRRTRDASGKDEKSAGDRYHELLTRIAHAPAASLIGAVRARSAEAVNEEMAELADLLYRHPDEGGERGRPFDRHGLAEIGNFVGEWGNRMLASGDASRLQLGSIAMLASRAPSLTLLPLLKRMLDENLRRFRAFREEAIASGWRQVNATNEARSPHTHEYQRAFYAIDAPETAALMREYLPDEHFGQVAANVLAAQWMSAHEPDVGKNLRGGVDFSHVQERRIARSINPAYSSAEADAIFNAVESLIVDGLTDEQKNHAVALGIVAARLPHGQRDATIQKLLSMATRRAGATLLQSLVLGGETIDIELVKAGIEDVFVEAKTKPWILDKEADELKDWLRLLPFVNRPVEAVAVVRALPEGQRRDDRLEVIINGLSSAPGEDAGRVLFELAQFDPSLYANYTWRESVINRGSITAAKNLLQLAAEGVFAKEKDSWQIAQKLGGLMTEHPELRAQVYQLLENGISGPGLALLARAVSEAPDIDGLLLLVKIDIDQKSSFISWRTIESTVTDRRPSENWQGAYEVVPVPAVELRQKLLALTTDGGPADVAARYLNQIDKIRDQFGAPDSEPRHPDLTSGRPWPIMTTDAEAE
jgi:hypothetical protein